MILIYTIPLIVAILLTIFVLYRGKVEGDSITVGEALVICIWVFTPGINIIYCIITIALINDTYKPFHNILNKRIL